VQRRLLLLVGVLFVSYLCVAIPLPIIPVFVTARLGLSNALAGLAVGSAFFSTILTRGYAGSRSDQRGARGAVLLGLVCYVAGALVTLGAGLVVAAPLVGLLVLLAGRLFLGLGESLVGVGVISWGVSLLGPARSGKVIALVGAAIYGALAVGGPVGLALYQHLGFSGAMAVSAILPALGLAVVLSIEGAPAPPAAARQSFVTVLARIWRHGAVVGLQGIGFAAIGAFFVLHFLHEGWSYAGLGFTAFGTGFVLVRLLLGHLPDKVGGLPVAIGSLAVEAVGQTLIAVAPGPILALVGAFFTGLGCSLVFPAMGREVVQLVEPNQRGTAVGGFAAFQDLAYGLTGPLAGILADRAGYGSVYLGGAIAAALGLALAVSLRRKKPLAK
jgi:MFS family permease